MSAVGLVLFMLTALVVGARVLLLHRATRKLPELLLGTALILVGFLCYAVGTAAKIWVPADESTRAFLTAVGLAIECLGQMALILFSWRVFHATERWAKLVAAALVSAIGFALAGELASGEYRRYADLTPISGPWVPLGLSARGAAPAWMAIECLAFYRKARRRLAIGLAEPIVVNRALLWGVGIGASALGYVVSVAHRLIYGTGLRAHELALGLVSALALVAAACISLAFFPPEAYRRWIEQGASARTPPGVSE